MYIYILFYYRLYELPDLLISVRYAFLINFMYTMAFYTSILPIVLFWTLLGLILTYFVDKVIIHYII